PIFVPSLPLMKPRTLWACQPVAFMSSSSVAPLGRLIRSRTFAPLLSARRVAFPLASVVLAAFLERAGFFGSVLVLPFLGDLVLVFAAVFLAAVLALRGFAVAIPWSPVAAASSVVMVASAFVMIL